MFALLLPTGSDHDRTRYPWATLILIAFNIIVFFLSNLGSYVEITRKFGFIAAGPEIYQFITHMFLHAGWPTAHDTHWTEYVNCILHIGGNMVFLWFAGSDLEDVLGRIKFLVVYFVGGIASALLFWWTAIAGGFPNLDEPAVGASGAVSALLGVYLVRFPRFKIRVWYGAFIPIPVILRQGIARVSSLFFIGFWISVQLVLGIHSLSVGGSQVAYLGHIGGFLLGIIVGLATRQARHGHREYYLKEADHLLYRRKWYHAMQFYQKLTEQDPRCAEAFVKWALCWECSGSPQRAERVLSEALTNYEERGWDTEAEEIRSELEAQRHPKEDSFTEQASVPINNEFGNNWGGTPNLLFRKQFKWEKKRHD